MALLSQVDWLILVGAGAFLLLGPNNGHFLRQVGRWYARAMRLKAELLNEVWSAAELPPVRPGAPTSLRAAFLDWTPEYTPTTPVRTAPNVAVAAWTATPEFEANGRRGAR